MPTVLFLLIQYDLLSLYFIPIKSLPNIFIINDIGVNTKKKINIIIIGAIIDPNNNPNLTGIKILNLLNLKAKKLLK